MADELTIMRVIRLEKTSEPGFYEIIGYGNYDISELTEPYVEVSSDPADVSYKYNNILASLYDTGMSHGLMYKDPNSVSGDWKFLDGYKYYLDTISEFDPQLASVNDWALPATLAISEASDRGVYSKSVALDDGSHLLLNFSRSNFFHPSIDVTKYELNGSQTTVGEFKLQDENDFSNFIRGSELSILSTEVHGTSLYLVCEIGSKIVLGDLDLTNYSFNIQELDFDNPNSSGVRASFAINEVEVNLAIIADGSNDVQLFKVANDKT